MENMWYSICFPWYQNRICQSCGKEFWRVREDSILNEIKWRINGEWKEKKSLGFVCSTSCALNQFSEMFEKRKR